MKKYLPIIIFAVLVLLTMIASVTGIINERIGICISLILVSILNLVVSIIAFKHEIKVVGILMILFMIVGLALLGLNLYSFFQSGRDLPDFKVNVVEGEKQKTKVFSQDDKNYYTYNLNSIDITLKDEDKKYSIEEAFLSHKLALKDLLEQSIPNENTNGYKIYYDGGDTEDGSDAYSIVVCENNNDVIFSTFNYVYTEDICQN